MKLFFLSVIAVCSIVSFGNAQDCLKRTPEIKPVLSAETKKVYDLKLAKAFEEYSRKKEDADSTIWLGRRTAYLGNYKDAIRIFGKGLVRFPNDARLWRHRGHRFITRRCFDEAIRNLERAAQLIKDKPDEVEPDGIPNAKNTPVSTLQTNIWYHLGLAYYLKGDNANASRAYKEGLKIAKNADMRTAFVYWQYMTLRNLGEDAEAKKLLETIPENTAVIENGDYLKLIEMFKGKTKPEILLSPNFNNSAIGYGVGNFYLMNGEKEKALAVFKKITEGDQWSSFGFIAAEAEINRAAEK